MKQGTPAAVVRGLVLVVLLVAATPCAVLARQATPVPSAAGITLAASGLENPRGFTWGLDGTHYIALAGSGPGQMPAAMPVGVHDMGGIGGLTGSVVYADASGHPVTFQDDLPSSMSAGGSARGPAAVALLANRVYVLSAGGGEQNGNPATPNGLYAVDGDGGAELVADLSAWVRANPVATPPGDATAEGDPFAMVAGDDELWVVEANSGQLLRVTPDGAITRLVDFSATHDVPTGLALAPDGGFYVGFLTTVPYTDGAARVVKVKPDGAVSDAWTGLRAITGVAYGPGGALYALEMGAGNTATPPFAQANTGKVVRQTGPAKSVDVATGLNRPISMDLGPDGGLYVSLPAIATDGELGGIVRIDPAISGPVAMPAGLIANSPCAPLETADATPVTVSGEVSPPAALDPGVVPVNEGTPAHLGDKQGLASLAVQIQGNAFTPASLEITAGGIVSWTNLDSVPHTVTATDGSFDSGTLDPGEAWGHAFDQAGTFTYGSTTDPGMQGTVVVGP